MGSLLSLIPLRGGHSNGHDMGLMAARLSDWTASQALPLRKELGGKALFSLVDLLTGGSFTALLWLQKLLWLAGAFLTYRLLRRGGLKPAAAGLGAGLVGLSFPALLLSSSFATAAANLVFVLAALTAAASLLEEQPRGQERKRLIWLAASGLLVLVSRFEFAPVVALAAALALGRRRRWAPLAALAALGAVAGLAWARFVGTEVHGGLVMPPLDNLAAEWGAENLTRLSGLPAVLAPWLAVFSLLAVAVRGDRRLKEFWLPLLAVWIAFFAFFYPSVTGFPFEALRHQLYFLLPLALLLACAASTVRWPWAATAAVLAGYAFASARVTKQAAAERRTNDLEWQLLYEARRDWPAGCKAVFPFVEDRAALLSRYFPSTAQPEKESCLLLYRSPVPQIFEWARVDPARLLNGEQAEDWYASPWKTSAFPHRCFMDEHGPLQETCDPVTVTVGFYRLDPAVAASPRWRAVGLDARLIEATSGDKSLASGLLAEAAAVDPKSLPSRGDEAKFLSDQGTLAALAGENDAAVALLRRAIAADRRYLPAYATLAGVYRGAKRAKEASEVSKAAAKVPVLPMYEGLAKIIAADAAADGK